MLTVTTEVHEALAACGAASCSSYLTTVEVASTESPAPYVQPEYVADCQRRACDPQWLCACLLANFVKEADGARQLDRFAHRIPGVLEDVADAVSRHAADEAKHSLVFLKLLRSVFPDAELSPRLQADIETHKPKSSALPPRSGQWAEYSVEQALDEICQINIGEIRTRINQLILRPVLLEHAPMRARGPVATMIDKLMRDEQQHIAYTAGILERVGTQEGRASFIDKTYRRRFSSFNRRTICELNGLDL